MNEIRILELIWDSFNEAYIWERHQLTQAEVEEVAYGSPELLKLQHTYGERFFVTGPKADKRLLVLILVPKGSGKFYLVSARSADKKERLEYRQWKEAHKHE
jgi:uncharacterized DUF497 family protein